jgi:hypothetical protein
MNHVEAMKQALEALELALRCHGVMLLSDPPKDAWKYHGVEADANKAITALRTAIEQAEKQEPRCAVIVEVFGKDWRLDYMSLPVGKHRLYTQEYVYTTPPAAQPCPTCEALARTVMMDQTAHDTITPPAAKRQPLTDEQIEAVWKVAMFEDNGRHALLDNQPFVHFARAIEAAHGIGEKNHSSIVSGS